MSARRCSARAARGQMRTRLIFALDVASLPRGAASWSTLLRGEVGIFKVGKQLFLHAGPDVVRDDPATRGGEVFLDLKFHDIPQTVATRRRRGDAARRARCSTCTPRAASTMMRATRRRGGAASAAASASRGRSILAVTVLTSLVARRPRSASACTAASRARWCGSRGWRARRGMDGVVASPHEIARIRRACGRELPDRHARHPAGERRRLDDQKRVDDARRRRSAPAPTTSSSGGRSARGRSGRRGARHRRRDGARVRGAAPVATAAGGRARRCPRPRPEPRDRARRRFCHRRHGPRRSWSVPSAGIVEGLSCRSRWSSTRLSGRRSASRSRSSSRGCSGGRRPTSTTTSSSGDASS